MLNANYLLSRVKHILPVPQGDRCMHEFVASARQTQGEKAASRRWTWPSGCSTIGFHAPTVYFPLTVREAMMIEPTETESKETLDAFAETLFRITEESADLLHDAPHTRRSAGPTKCGRRAAADPQMGGRCSERLKAATAGTQNSASEPVRGCQYSRHALDHSSAGFRRLEHGGG